MGCKLKSFDECCVCGKLLRRPGKRCSGCSRIYYKIKLINPDVNEDELIRLTKEKRNKIMKNQRDKWISDK